MTDNIFAHEHPESERARGGGFTLWFTGLSGSGKTTIAHLVGPALDERGHVVEYLDGDTIRTHLSKGLGFSKEDRDTNIERIGWEECDVICGLVVVGDETVATGMMRVTCDAEPDGGRSESEEVEEIVEAVSERELVTVGPGPSRDPLTRPA